MNNQGRKRERIVNELQEWIFNIDEQIEELQQDKEFFQSVLSELH